MAKEPKPKPNHVIILKFGNRGRSSGVVARPSGAALPPVPPPGSNKGKVQKKNGRR